MAAMGQEPTDEELFDMIAEVDSDGSGEIGAPPDSAGKGRCLTSPRLRLADFSEFRPFIHVHRVQIATISHHGGSAPIAQLVERGTFNLVASGSSPDGGELFAFFSFFHVEPRWG